MLDWGCRTTFHDGSQWGAFPHDTHHYHVIAHRCGYGDDILRYAQEHEVCHLVAEEWLWDRPSRVLWALAHGDEIAPHDAACEEAVTMTVQRWLRANERPIIGGVDWDGLKRYMLEKLGE